MKYKGEEILNVPNILSAYRLLSFPFVLALILTGHETLYFWMILFNQFTDILDGLIARLFKLHTRFGARLDSLADTSTYILVLTGIVIFKKDFVHDYSTWLILFFSVYLLRHMITLIKFRRYAGMHLNSLRYCSLLQVALFCIIFLGGPLSVAVYLTISLSILAFLEEIVLVLIMKEPAVHIKSIFHFMKHQKE